MAQTRKAQKTASSLGYIHMSETRPAALESIAGVGWQPVSIDDVTPLDEETEQ